jgi:dipeptidyl aminopeptidase/acylaminoacyl peptidase
LARVGIGGITLTGDDETITAHGVELPIVVYRPAAATPAPAVIICPGGIAKGMFEVMEWIGARLRDAGIFAVTASWRSGNPENDVADISLVVDWLEKQPGVDAKRIGIFGISRGGNAALCGLALEPRIKAGATFGPATDFLAQILGLKLYAPTRCKILIDWLGDPDTNRAFYEKIQAASYVDRLTKPLLLVHGAHDMHCPIEQSILIKEGAERHGNKDVRMEVIPMMGHYGDMVPNSYGFDLLASHFVPFFKEKL